MKRIKLLTIIVFLSLLLINKEGYSQLRYSFAFEYSTAFNMGPATDYISDPSFAGFSTSFKAITNKNLLYGVELGWNNFSQEFTGTTEFPNGAINGFQGKDLNYVPVLAGIGYAFGNKRGSKMTTYAQMNVGAFYVTQQLQLGVTTLTNNGWNFGFGPEIGIVYNAGQNFGITLNGKYNYAVSNGGTSYSNGTTSRTIGDIDYSFFNINLGIAYIE